MTYLDFHRTLLADKIRTESYRRAIFQQIKKGDVVLDLGSGTGILALMACQAGAKRVYAIESGEITEIAKRLSAENGFDDRIHFIRNFSYKVRLPEKVDAIVTETMGNFGLEEGILHSVRDARKRFLKKTGTLIPRSIELFVVPIESRKAYQKIDFWSAQRYGINLSSLREIASNRFYAIDLKSRDFLSKPLRIFHAPLNEIQSANVSGEVSFVLKRRASLHGIGGWFRTELCPGLFLSNAPPNQTPNWKNIFLPIERPFPVRPGDRLNVRVFSTSRGAVLSWQVDFPGRKMHFNQSNFFSFAWSKKLIKRKERGF